jgi:hypothetical protein
MGNQLTRGAKRRVLYVENKDGTVDGANGRIGWVTFSKTGQSVYYRDKVLRKISGIRGNFREETTGEEYWVSGVKKRGSNGHWAEAPAIVVDEDAREEYERILSQ